MSFSESIKLKVKRKAAFKCCRCQNIGIDVHHIIPQSERGPDTFENAAPLCQNCHDQIGQNPAKRKEIKQMRDWWYDVCEHKYAIMEFPYEENVNQINNTLIKIQKGQQNLVPILVDELRDLFNKSAPSVTAPSSATFATGIVESSTGFSYQLPTCKECGRTTTILSDGFCSECYNKQKPK